VLAPRRLALLATVCAGLGAGPGSAIAADPLQPLVAVVSPAGVTIASSSGGAFAYPADGSVISIGGDDGTTLRDVSLLGGALAAQTIAVGEPTTVTGLTVAGTPVAAADNLVEPIAAGWAMVQQHAVVPGADGGAGRETAVGLRLHLLHAAGGLAAGTEILVGSHVYGTAPAASGGSSTSGAPLAAATAEIPAELIPIYRAAGARWGVDWTLLAAINKIETDFGRNVSTSSAGAIGWMQFMPGTWKGYGYDANGDGTADPYDPADAIGAAARLLAANGVATNPYQAVFSYNHADWYVQQVLAQARAYGSGNQADARVPVSADGQGFSPVHLW
jgi:hypothetical protein